MTIGSFNNSLKKVEEFLKQVDLFRQKGVKSVNNDGVSGEFKSASQKSDYFVAYKAGLKNYDFDILLTDESFFQFEFKADLNNDVPEVRYAFFQNPQEYKTYNEYLELLRADGVIEENDEDVGNIFQEDYEQFLIEQHINHRSTSIRFDVDFSNYKPLIHSVAHFHIGHQNNIRIPCDKIITPYMFVIFVVKHVYYLIWKELVESNNISIIKQDCYDLTSSMWIHKETQELFIK